MTPLKEYGECVIGAGDREYFFRPSFAAMSRIGEPQDIVMAFYDLHNDELTPLLQRATQAFIHDGYGQLPACVLEYLKSGMVGRSAIMAAHTVLTACCEDDISELIGWLVPGRSGRRGFVWRKGAMSPLEMVLVAQSLIMHGVMGKAKIRKLQRHESNETTAEFRAADYIMAARNHFGISREEAENLTMTEFSLLLNAKYPNQKGFTREEFDSVMSEDDKRWNAMLAAEEAGKMNKRLG